MDASAAAPEAKKKLNDVWSSASKVMPVKPVEQASQTHTDDIAYDKQDFFIDYDPTVTRQLKEAMIAKGTGGQQEQAALQTFRTMDILGNLEKVFQQYDLTINDLGDVFTAYWVTSWQIVHRKPDPKKPEIHAARKQIRLIIASNPAIKNLQGPLRQQMAEIMMYQMVFAAGLYEEARKTNNKPVMNFVSELMNQMMISNGFNMKKYKLTKAGFVPL